MFPVEAGGDQPSAELYMSKGMNMSLILRLIVLPTEGFIGSIVT